MNTRRASTICSPDVDNLLASLIEEITEALERGEPVDLEAYGIAYPEHAERLRRLVPALLLLENAAMAKAGQDGAQTGEGKDAVVPGVLGDFRILRELGRGGMGIVYEAEQISLGRRMALKVLTFASVLDERHLLRFHNEARAAASLKHPNIVGVHSVGCERGVHFYAMEYIEGQTLAEIIRRLRQSSARTTTVAAAERAADSTAGAQAAAETRGSDASDRTTRSSTTDKGFFRRIAEWGIQAAEGLEHAHQMGIVHRDIKPSNLLVDQRGHLWITDFGLAHIQTDKGLTFSGDVLGTLRYMSPEQASGHTHVLDHHSDIYSLGVTLYELLTLRLPFGGDDRAQVLRQIIDDEPPAPRRLNRAIPKDLETIVLTAMAKDPRSRFRTAQALADDLRRFLEDKPIRARRPSLADCAAKWCRRHRSVVCWMVVLLVLTSVLSAAAAGLIARARNEALRQRNEVLNREADLRRYLYAADTAWAWQAWNNGDVARARRLLSTHWPAPGQADLRSFAWYHLWQLCHSSSRTLQGHTAVVYCVTFSPDGKLLASGGADRTIRLWDPGSGESRATLQGHTDDVNHIAYSPDGRLLATAGEERLVRLWETASGQAIRTLGPFDLPVSTVLFAADGMILIAAEVDWPSGTSKTSLWNPRTGERLHTIDGQRALALSRDGRVLATSSPKGHLRLWDLNSREELVSTKAHTAEILAGAFSPDGTILAAGARDGYLRLFQTAHLEERISLIGHFSDVRSLAFSPDNRFLVSVADEGVARVWDPRSGNMLKVLSGHSDRLWSVSFPPDGSTVATAASDKTVKLWDVRQVLGPLSLPRHAQPVTSIAFLPDSRTLATVCGDSRIRLWNIASGSSERVVETTKNTAPCLAISAARGLLAIALEGGNIELRDLNSFSLRRSWLCPQPFARQIAFSPDGALLASDGFARLAPKENGMTSLWDVSTGELVLTVPWPNNRPYWGPGVVFSPDGGAVATVAGNELATYDLTSKELHAFPIGHFGSVHCLARSPDGKMFASGATDRAIRLLDAATGQQRGALLGHGGAVMAVAFSPDGRTLASGSDSGEVKLWDVFTNRELASLPGHAGTVHCLVFSADGTRLAASGYVPDGSGEVTIWQAPRPEKSEIRSTKFETTPNRE